MADRAAVQTLTERFPPARTVLAGLLLAMAAGQVSDVPGFARILGDYRFFPGAEPWPPS